MRFYAQNSWGGLFQAAATSFACDLVVDHGDVVFVVVASALDHEARGCFSVHVRNTGIPVDPVGGAVSCNDTL